MHCPKCGSSNVQFVTNNKSTGPSITSGCCGYILLGPIGLLCALCGISNEHEEYWLCQGCGNRFNENESLEAKAKNLDDKIRSLTYDVNNMKKKIMEIENSRSKILEAEPIRYAQLIEEVSISKDSAQEIYNSKNKQYKEKEKELLKDNKYLIVFKASKWLVLLISIIVALAAFSEDNIFLVILMLVVCIVLWKTCNKLYDKQILKINSPCTTQMKELDIERELASGYKQQYILRKDLEKKEQEIEELYNRKKELGM